MGFWGVVTSLIVCASSLAGVEIGFKDRRGIAIVKLDNLPERESYFFIEGDDAYQLRVTHTVQGWIQKYVTIEGTESGAPVLELFYYNPSSASFDRFPEQRLEKMSRIANENLEARIGSGDLKLHFLPNRLPSPCQAILAKHGGKYF